jgi:hypothetical protein
VVDSHAIEEVAPPAGLRPPYVAHLINGLPRFNEWVFASVRLKKGRKGAPPEWVQASASGRLAEPRAPHTVVLADAGIPHGYRPRSIDALRPYLAQIERFILDKAGIQFDPATAAAGGLRVVA